MGVFKDGNCVGAFGACALLSKTEPLAPGASMLTANLIREGYTENMPSAASIEIR